MIQANDSEMSLPVQSIGSINKYLALQEIGAGWHLYPVFKALNPESFIEEYKTVVIKAIQTDDKLNSYANELAISELESHPNILKALEAIPEFAVDFGRFKDMKFNLLVFPFLPNGDLYDFIQKWSLNESVARHFIGQIADAVQYLHKNGFAHRDIKLENILLDAEYNAVVTDFGHAVKHSDAAGPISFSRGTTPGIAPPEYYDAKSYRGKDMDMFAIGKLLFQLVTGSNPFVEATTKDIFYSKIRQGEWEPYWKFFEKARSKKGGLPSLSDEFKTLIEGLLEPNPEKRFDMEKLRESEWFKNTKPVAVKDLVI